MQNWPAEDYKQECYT